MDLLPALPAFFLAVLLISASPGPAMALILRRAALRGFRRTVPIVLGLEAGLYLWALLAAAGVAALVAASGGTGGRWGGARHGTAGGAGRAGAGRRLAGVRRGRRGAVANPKAAVFMVAFFPRFVPADHPVFATTAVLAGLQVGLETVLYLSLAASVASAGGWFRRPAVRRRLEAVSGTVLVGLGLRVAAVSH